jgi:hypothetical protein
MLIGNIRDELSVHQGLILKGSKIVIPTKMRKEILIKIHAGDQGREKCKQCARQVVFWPGMNSDIDNIVERHANNTNITTRKNH